VSPYYDAMLAKVIAWAPTRQAAIERLNRGLEETDVRGIVTNIPFLSALVTHPHVRANAIDTGFIERELKKLTEASARSAISSFARRWPPSCEEQKAHAGRRIRRGRPSAGCRSAAAAGVLVPQGQGAEHKVTLHMATGIRRCRSASTFVSHFACRWRRFRPDARRHEIACRRRDRGP
jgi:3-methylcrotonyl-CoA carboxylase alpha subunit